MIFKAGLLLFSTFPDTLLQLQSIIYMKAQVLGEHLQKKLPLLTHAISSRSQLPILLHILLETKQDKLYLSTTDLEIGIEINIPANIEEEGGIAIPARVFVELINSLPPDKITFHSTNTTLEISTIKTKSDIITMNKDEFPLLYEEKGTLLIRMPAEELRKYFSRVVFSASTDTTRPSLSGMLLRKKEQGLLFVATDGYRLSLEQTAQQATNDIAIPSIIIPARVIREALSLKQDEEIDIHISKKNNQVLFSQSEIVLVGRLIDADFPNFEKILPSNYSTKIHFDREDLQKAVKLCAIFAKEAGNVIKLTIKSDRIIVSANTPSVGENRVEVEATIEGEEKEIAFNAKYLLDILSSVSDDAMSLEMTGPLNPGVFKVKNDPAFLHLIMPIRTQG